MADVKRRARSLSWDAEFIAKIAVNVLMKILCKSYLEENLNFAEEECKKLKDFIHGCIPKELVNTQSAEILLNVIDVKRKIKRFEQFPWFKNVMELFRESAIHPETSAIWYKPNSGKLGLQYFTEHLVKRRTLKAFILKEFRTKHFGRYEWDPGYGTFKALLRMLKREKKVKNIRRCIADQCDNPLMREMLLQILKEDEDRAAAAKTQEIKLVDLFNRLDALQVFIFPTLCNQYYLKSISSLATLRIVDVSSSILITNASIPLLGSFPNLEALNILSTSIDESGTVALLQNLLETRKDQLRYFLGPKILTGKALELLHEFSSMKKYDITLRYFRDLYNFPNDISYSIT